MYRNSRVSVVLPCYNEAHGLRQLLPDLPSCVDELIVVDNGSLDETRAVATSYGAKVVVEERRGVGYAYQRGLIHAAGDLIVCLDGDATYPVQAIPSLLDRCEQDQLDFLSGCRFPLISPDAMSLRNRGGNCLLSWAANGFFRLQLGDVMSGMWIIRRSSLPQLSFRLGGVPSCIEVKLSAFLNPRLRSAEAHISYGKRLGKSKLAPWRDGWQCLAFMWRWKQQWRASFTDVSVPTLGLHPSHLS